MVGALRSQHNSLAQGLGPNWARYNFLFAGKPHVSARHWCGCSHQYATGAYLDFTRRGLACLGRLGGGGVALRESVFFCDVAMAPSKVSSFFGLAYGLGELEACHSARKGGPILSLEPVTPESAVLIAVSARVFEGRGF